jgi:hypothetical protein
LLIIFILDYSYDDIIFFDNNDKIEEGNSNINKEKSISNESTPINNNYKIESNLKNISESKSNTNIFNIKIGDKLDKRVIENTFDTALLSTKTLLVGLGASQIAKAPGFIPKIGSVVATAATTTLSGAIIDTVKYNVLDNLDDLNNDRPPSPGSGGFNFIDTNTLFFRLQSIINNFDNLDTNLKLIIYCILILFICIFYIIYIFSFVVSPLIFDTIKDILPLKIKNFLVKFININRKISVPFVIMNFIITIFILLLVIFSLSTIIIFKSQL